MPELITETLLVVERFKHGGEEYERGDRLPVRHRWVRRVARENPEWFRMEYAPEDVDLALLDSIERHAAPGDSLGDGTFGMQDGQCVPLQFGVGQPLIAIPTGHADFAERGRALE